MYRVSVYYQGQVPDVRVDRWESRLPDLPGCAVTIDSGDGNVITMFFEDMEHVRKLASRLCQAVGRAESERPAGGPESHGEATKGEGATTES